MTQMTSSTRVPITAFRAASPLLQPSPPASRLPNPSTPSNFIRRRLPPLIVAIVLALLLPTATLAIAIQDTVTLPLPYRAEQLERRGERKFVRRDWSTWNPDCTSTQESTSALSADIAGHTSLEPVTVTVTVRLPNSSYTSPIATASGYAAGSPSLNGTATGSPVPSTRTSSSTVSSPTVDPVVASAQEAQQLNLAFQSLKTGDPCTPGQRACISSQLAECSVPASSSSADVPRWVTQACVIGSDPNQTPICAALPDFSTNSSSPTTESTSSTSSVPPVVLNCFNPTDIQQAFNSAGVTGGMFPPGTQTSASPRMLARKDLGGVAIILALTAFMLP